MIELVLGALFGVVVFALGFVFGAATYKAFVENDN